MIMIAISASKNCNYCETAYHTFCAMMGGDSDQINSLKNTSSLTDSGNPKEKAAIDFAVRLSKDPKSSSDNDFELLVGLGYTKSQVMELIAISSMAVFYNHLADATKINIDDEFMAVL